MHNYINSDVTSGHDYEARDKPTVEYNAHT